MKKRHQLESEFNDKLKDQELMVKFKGNHELILIGAPSDNLASRVVMSFSGLLLVTFCLITAGTESANATFIIGGCLLGLIMTSTPFVSFYSKKYFKISISRNLKQISISKGINNPDKRIDFSNIDCIKVEKLALDDLIIGEQDDGISYQHRFVAMIKKRPHELFSFLSKEKAFEEFVSDFGSFLSQFIHKDVKFENA